MSRKRSGLHYKNEFGQIILQKFTLNWSTDSDWVVLYKSPVHLRDAVLSKKQGPLVYVSTARRYYTEASGLGSTVFNHVPEL